MERDSGERGIYLERGSERRIEKREREIKRPRERDEYSCLGTGRWIRQREVVV